MVPSVLPVVSLRELLATALAIRREAAARYRQLAAEPAVRAAPAIARAFSRLSLLETEQAARIEADLPDIDVGTILAERVTWAEPDRFRVAVGPLTLNDVLEMAQRNERTMRAIFEHVAATSPNEGVRLRALQFALGESRHLSAIEEAVDAARGGKA